MLRAVALRGCINMSYRVRGKDKNEKENRERVQNEKRSRGRVKMRNGVGEATGGTWPTYSRGGAGEEQEEMWKIKEWEGKRRGEGAGERKGGRRRRTGEAKRRR